jgi:hypothetical protein
MLVCRMMVGDLTGRAPMLELFPLYSEFPGVRPSRRMNYGCAYRCPLCELEYEPVESSLRFPKLSVCAPGQLFQHEPREDAPAAELDPCVYQLNNYVLALLADCRYVFHLDNEFATTKVYSCVFACTPKLGGPGRNEVALHNQPTLGGTINERDLHHCFLTSSDKARRAPNRLGP